MSFKLRRFLTFLQKTNGVVNIPHLQNVINGMVHTKQQCVSRVETFHDMKAPLLDNFNEVAE